MTKILENILLLIANPSPDIIIIIMYARMTPGMTAGSIYLGMIMVQYHH